MVTYEQWNRAIISYFFEGHDDPFEIVFLQTDANTLLDIAIQSNFNGANVDEAVSSLTQAVRKQVVYNGLVDFWKIDPTKIFLKGSRSEEEPPQVAFLALAVLAASLMKSEDSVGAKKSVGANNYYIRLNELLLGQVVEGAPPGFNRDEFEDLWKHLQRWAINHHDVVLYLTEGSTKRRFVWYPISQCLISRHDRRSIYRFFRNYNLSPFSDISDSQLEKKLFAWLQSADGSAKIKRYFSTESYKESILNQIKSVFEHWDGEVLPEPLPGQRQTTSLIRVELRFDQVDNVEIRYWFSRRGREEINCNTNRLKIQYLQASHLEKWFRPIIDDSGVFWNLQNRLQLHTDESNPIVYTLGTADVWVFRKDPDQDRDGNWFSQPSMQLYEDHLIVFRKQLTNQVIDCLRKTCGREIEKPSSVYVDGEENDWLYLRGTPTKSESFSEQKLWKLSVTAGKRLSFIGGLPVTDEYDRKAYLDPYLPNVFVPYLGVSDQEVLQINGEEFSLDQNRLVTLHNVLGPGVYQLTYGGQTRELRVISPKRSLEHHDQTLIAALSIDQATVPAYSIKKVEEVSEKFGLWFTGVKFFGTDIPKVSWEDVQKIPPEPLPPEPSFKIPANVISSVVQVAIDLKKGKTSSPDWLEEALEYLEQNVALRALVEKKLNIYHEKALSYGELCEQVGR